MNNTTSILALLILSCGTDPATPDPGDPVDAVAYGLADGTYAVSGELALLSECMPDSVPLPLPSMSDIADVELGVVIRDGALIVEDATEDSSWAFIFAGTFVPLPLDVTGGARVFHLRYEDVREQDQGCSFLQINDTRITATAEDVFHFDFVYESTLTCPDATDQICRFGYALSFARE